MNVYTAKDVAQMLKVKESTVLSWARQGRIDSFNPAGSRLVRITEEAITKFLKQKGD